MAFIKDKEFLPEVKNVSDDVYKLLYGIVRLRNEKKIYDTVAIMCRQYPETPLRRAKIMTWKSEVSKSIQKLEALDDSGRLIYIPYFEFVGSVAGILSLFNFTLCVLNEMYELERIPEYRRGTTRDSVLLYYPTQKFVVLLREFGRKCVINKSVEGDVEAAIEKELEERGLIESSNLQVKETYDEIFFEKESNITLSPIQQTNDNDDGEEEGEEGVINKKERTGFVYYALKEYFEEVNSKQWKKDYVFGTLLATASFRITNGVLEPEGEFKTQNNNVYGKYVEDFRKKKLSQKTQAGILRLLNKFLPQKKQPRKTL